jgi:Formate/nitrite transporter
MRATDMCALALVFNLSSCQPPFLFSSANLSSVDFPPTNPTLHISIGTKANMDAFTPAQTTELVSRIGAKKARMRIDKMFINSFMGGALISFGCALALSTNTAPWFQTNAPGLIRTIGAMVFPVGLISKSTSSRPFNFLNTSKDNLQTFSY